MDGRQRSQVAVGAVLVVVGLVLLAGQMDVPLPLALRLNLRQSWPAILIIMGLAKMAGDGEGRFAGGAWLVLVGGVLLLHTYDILWLSESWPLFVVAAGVSMLFGRPDERRTKGDGHVH